MRLSVSHRSGGLLACQTVLLVLMLPPQRCPALSRTSAMNFHDAAKTLALWPFWRNREA